MPNSNLKALYSSRQFLVRLVPTVAVLVLVLLLFTRFLTWVEQRPGVVLADPLLAVLPPADMTWFTFAFIYCALVAAIVHLVRHPGRLLLALHSYTLLVLARMGAMYLLPLDPPASMLPLADPLVELFGSGGVTLSRDLFFSGHVSTLSLLALTAKNSKLRALFVACTVLVGVCVLVQHVHYGIDVWAAPFFAWGCFSIAKWLNNRFPQAGQPGSVQESRP